jgi:hypothetical protein
MKNQIDQAFLNSFLCIFIEFNIIDRVYSANYNSLQPDLNQGKPEPAADPGYIGALLASFWLAGL